MSNDKSNDYTMIGSVSGVTKEQAEKIEEEFVKIKREIAPEGLGTSAIGKSKSFSGTKHKEIKGE